MVATIVATSFMEWLTGLSNGEATLYGVILTFVLTIIWWLARQHWGQRGKRRKAEAEEHLRRRQEREADFRKGPAELGEADHGVLSTQSLSEIAAALVSTLPILKRLTDAFLGDTIHVLHADKNADNRQRILKQTAEDLYPDVLSLEGIALAVGPRVSAFVNAYRVLLRDGREIDQEERRTIEELKPVLGSHLVSKFGVVSDVIGGLEKRIASMEGKQEDLPRMVKRTRDALRGIDQAVKSMIEFCSGELSQAIDSRLKS